MASSSEKIAAYPANKQRNRVHAGLSLQPTRQDTFACSTLAWLNLMKTDFHFEATIWISLCTLTPNSLEHSEFIRVLNEPFSQAVSNMQGSMRLLAPHLYWSIFKVIPHGRIRNSIPRLLCPLRRRRLRPPRCSNCQGLAEASDGNSVSSDLR